MAAISPLPETEVKSNTSQKVIAWGVVLAMCYWAQAVVITVLCALLAACLLEPVVAGLVRLRLPRALASMMVCLLALVGLYFVAALFYSRSVAFVAVLPQYETTIREAVEKISQRVQNLEGGFTRFLPRQRQQQIAQAIETRRPRTRTRQEAPPQPPPVQEVRLKQEEGLLTRYVFPQLKFFTEFLLFASFTPFLVYFMLSWKDHLRHSFMNLFRLEHRQIVYISMHSLGAMVRGFLVGNFLLGLLLALLSALIFWYLRIPFPIMMGAASGLLSIIPYVGLPLALIPPLFAALGVYSELSSYLIIISVVSGLHLVALNVLYPKLVGARVHLNPLVVTVAILVWAWMWGAIGLLLAIPIAAGLKAVCDNVPGLRQYGRLLGD